MLQKIKVIIAFSLIPQYALIQLTSRYPEAIERYYSHGIYPFTSRVLRYLLGWIPFSVGDLILGGVLLYSVRWLIVNRKRIIKDFKAWLIDVFFAVALVFFAFYFFWGMNYYRLPIHKTLNISTAYTTEMLTEVTKKLISKSNAIHFSITKNDTLQVSVPYSRKELLQKSANGYKALAQQHPKLAHNTTSTKLCLYSLPQAYMGFSGYINPFTNEAQVNYLTPLYQLPDTICHEQAHQIGYAAENETNFIGNLAAIYNNNLYFKYSGYVSALKDCLNEVYRRDRKQYATLAKSINSGIRKNYQESRDFWDAYENPLEPLFKSSYNTFLKANKQSKGIKSYSYVVALLVNYFKDKEL